MSLHASSPVAPGRIGTLIRDAYPGYFAMIMATGIVSNSAGALGFGVLSDFLFALNVFLFPLLLIVLAARALHYRAALWRDLTDPKLVFSFFTVVAAADVFGIQCFLRGFTTAALALWLFALAAWIFLSYFSFSVLMFINTRRGADIVHGGWLIAIVGTESLTVLGAMLAPRFGPELSAVIFVGAHMLWGVGVVLYGIFITLFSHRLFFLRVDASDVTPLLWVVMGASAIGANAGSMLILSNPPMPFLLAMRPFVDGTTLILWAWATWWTPLLVVLGFWKHVIRRVPITYHPMYWSLVFPLGMYTLTTYRLSLATDFPPLQWIPRVMLWVAVAAWALTFVAALRANVRRPAR
ncbi:tellurite resistance/C4-dicarboxylate transporter family protein [Trinickia caryophylli]|uniref:Tellurite resistance protein TehA n=1 Tax=Trinickia caryophylli TaxID=28094 RepID=A0A1X7FTK5_TRICW|nr:tellurite resistance/C4-dicarboxylate transporter family protein [Trinickia caryophylli]WQE15622.1 tellurite resistance/C4-dicarboxylate transporter family protein [Trinickia caryophylli]GLU33614.1 C4-dicarboxylate transporter [Trinickia caryophylli]SMF58580.1 Tellurite resistance protein TehA [Trinickia caryophylli]